MSESNNQNKIIDETIQKDKESTTTKTDSSTPSTPTESPQTQEPKNEVQDQAELSEVETGSKDQPDFEEIINFNHTYLNYRICQTFSDKALLDASTFNLLITNVFIYSGKVIDFKSMTSISNSEAVKNIRQKINSYKDEDLSNKITFIENVPFYLKTV